MANIVDNNLVITGDIAIDLITKLYEEGMQYWIPRPRYLSEEFHTKEFQSNVFPLWYEWSLDHWGTKWDIYAEDREMSIHDDNCAELGFLTANSSIEPFCNALSEMYPRLKLELFYKEEFDEEFTRREWRNDA